MAIKNLNYQGMELVPLLQSQFKSWHLSRLKFVSLFVLSVCKVSSVLLHKIAQGFDSEAETESSMRRIQRFLSGFELDYHQFASFLLSLAGLGEEKLVLILDRTNWKFGKQNLNVLMLAVAYQNMAIPLFWIMMPKFGNSNTEERISLIRAFVDRFGWHRIAYLVADREFIGQEWMNWLIANEIAFYLRVRNNLYRQTSKGKQPIKSLFQGRPFHQPYYLPKPQKVLGTYVYLAGMRLPKGEYLILACYHQPQWAIDRYKRRWEIETLFGALKSRGFDLEKTHLKELDRVRKLIALLAIAFIWAYLIGIWKDQNIKPIRLIKNKIRNRSLFRYGLDHLKNCLLNTKKQHTIFDCFKLLSCT